MKLQNNPLDRDLLQLNDPDAQKLICEIVKSAADVKAFDFVALDVSQVFHLSDYFIVISGRSDRHVQGIVNKISSTLAEQGIKPLAIEGMDKAHWVLLDYGSVLVHVFYEQIRYTYHLEALWLNAGKITLENYLKTLHEKQAA